MFLAKEFSLTVYGSQCIMRAGRINSDSEPFAPRDLPSSLVHTRNLVDGIKSLSLADTNTDRHSSYLRAKRRIVYVLAKRSCLKKLTASQQGGNRGAQFWGRRYKRNSLHYHQKTPGGTWSNWMSSGWAEEELSETSLRTGGRAALRRRPCNSWVLELQAPALTMGKMRPEAIGLRGLVRAGTTAPII